MVCVSGGSERMTGAQVAGVVADLGAPGGTTVAQWVAKARVESRFRFKCHNEINAVGLWQIRDIHYATMAGRISSTFTDKATFASWLENPRQNFQAAKILYEQSGWQPWAASGGRPTPNADDNAAAAAPDDSGGWQRGVGDVVEGAVDTVTDPLAGIAAVAESIRAAFAAVIEFANRIGAWISEPGNWLRVAQVAGGLTLGVGAILIVARPAVEDVTGEVVKTMNKGG